MEQYINKDALVAEIKKRVKTNKECMLGLRNLDYYQGKVDALNYTISFLDTIEVKESEDERIREVLIDYFNRYKEQEECGVKTFYGIPTDNILAWLKPINKPLAPWKPSKEQIEALEYSLGDYNIKIFEDRYEILKSLYNDLKKLKEE